MMIKMNIKDNYTSPYILAADIGGSHICTAICDIRSNVLIPESLTRAELYSKGSAAHILEAWTAAFKETLRKVDLKIAGIGLAMPGPFDYEKGISYIRGLDKYEALYGMDIAGYLADAMEMNSSQIRFRNDAEATIAGEVLNGAGKGFSSVIGVTLGTGFGSAKYNGDRTDDLNLGSEPFKNSIADDYLSTRWFQKAYYELTGLSVTGVKDLAEIAAENKAARDVFKEFAINMSDFLLEPLLENKPEVLLICGNIARASALFLPSVRRRLNTVRIKVAELGEDAALIGVASLFEHLSSPISL